MNLKKYMENIRFIDLMPLQYRSFTRQIKFRRDMSSDITSLLYIIASLSNNLLCSKILDIVAHFINEILL